MSHLKITRNEICTKIHMFVKISNFTNLKKKYCCYKQMYDIYLKPFTSLKMKSIRHIYWIYFTAVK
jgi:hypothetical protein